MTKEYYSDFTEQNYSKTDFIDLLARRIRKDLRNNTPLNMKTNYCLYENGILTKLVAQLLTQIFEKRLNLIILPVKTTNFEEVEFLDDSYLEKYISKRVGVFFKKKEVKNLKSKFIPILRTITFEELNQLKDIFNIDGDLEKETLEFIEKLNKEYSQTKASFLKSFNYINKLLDSD